MLSDRDRKYQLHNNGFSENRQAEESVVHRWALPVSFHSIDRTSQLQFFDEQASTSIIDPKKTQVDMRI